MVLLFGNNMQNNNVTKGPKILSNKNIAKEIATLVRDAKVSDDALVKITRQLNFWFSEGLSDDELVSLTKRLIDVTVVSSPDDSDFKCPKVRFGKTEIMIPIVTTGGMRVQWTWLADKNPNKLLTPDRNRLLNSTSQENLKVIIRRCIKQGFIHFETARMYGTSEFQFAVAFKEMLDANEFKRKDFILQTKIFPLPTKKAFLEKWNETWSHFGERVGYIDLFAFHCSSSPKNFHYIFNNGEDSLMAFAKQLQREGKIKHIGFSTHGCGETITKLIDTKEFDFVNLHYHFFGSYHAEGTINPYGGHGNKNSVKRALDLDMGVFNISPIDKGGYLQCPSAVVARTIGPHISPITFALLTNWNTFAFHTSSVGFGRPTDVDEAAHAASLLHDASTMKEVKAANERLTALAKEKLGNEWYKKGLLNIPSCYNKETDGIAIGHILWLHNLITAFGMYHFAKQRYTMLESGRAGKTTFEDYIQKVPEGNPGLSYDPNFDLTKALSNHYNPKLALKKIVEVHSWLSKDVVFTEKELEARGWNFAYDLQTWDIFGHSSPKDIILFNLTGGILRTIDNGPKSNKWMKELKQTKASYRNVLPF